jgi:acetyltransferase-like isoleucine patch superfamily enzyme
MRTIAKRLANYCALGLTLPFASAYWLSAWIFGAMRSFPGWSQLMSLLPGMPGVYLRRAFYRWVLPRCGQGSFISFGSIFSHPTVCIGTNTYVGAFCCMGDLTLEDDVLVGSHVSIMNGSRQHGIERLDLPVREQPGQWPRITIGQDTWIGDRAVVMTDVGAHCVIGAGAVVTRPVPDYAIVAGVPAKVVGWRKEHAPCEPPIHCGSDFSRPVTV